MSKHLILVDRPADWPADLPALPVMSAKDYIDADDTAGLAADRELRVLNLCRNYRYGSIGYYCSLLAEARGRGVGVEALVDGWLRKSLAADRKKRGAHK